MTRSRNLRPPAQPTTMGDSVSGFLNGSYGLACPPSQIGTAQTELRRVKFRLSGIAADTCLSTIGLVVSAPLNATF